MEYIIGQKPAGAGQTPLAGQPKSAEPMGAAGQDWIKESSARTFVADVIEASRQVPVLVDFWAPWCGPCRQLTPVLEKVVKEAKGRVRLVKINIDENQDIARQLRIQSIPAVFAFVGGQPFDGFMGALPEKQVRAFIDRLTGAAGDGGVDDALAAALETLQGGDPATAAQIFAQILQEDSQNARALAGLARCYLASGDTARAQQTLDLVPPDQNSHDDVTAARAQINLAAQANVSAGARGALEARLHANAQDHEARFELAKVLAAEGHNAEAVDALLTIIKADRSWNEGAARQHLLTVFDALGPTDEIVRNGRRRLSTLLFS